ncbi:hypothetical protein EDM26_06720 [Staphylococcus aureus]|nr:hypothetical protein EDM26_06720 [Staphylococcus aureus]
MFLSLKTLYRKRTVIWPFYFYTIIRTLSYYESFLCFININYQKSYMYNNLECLSTQHCKQNAKKYISF